MQEWQGVCKNAGVEVFVCKCRSGRTYVRMLEGQGWCKGAGVAGLL